MKAFFEGKHVTVKIDMPGTQEGVDVHADTTRAIDAQEYGNRLRLRDGDPGTGDSAVVTLVKVKKDLIEFRGRRGTDTFGDDEATVYMPPAEEDRRGDLETWSGRNPIH